MSLDPTIVQQLPTATLDSTDVGDAVVKYLTNINLSEVAADHESRIAFGEKKYGQRLKINNGRDAIMDAYQECLDGLSYLMQAYLEGKTEIKDGRWPEVKDFDPLEHFNHIAEIAKVLRDYLAPTVSGEAGVHGE